MRRPRFSRFPRRFIRFPRFGRGGRSGFGLIIFIITVGLMVLFFFGN